MKKAKQMILLYLLHIYQQSPKSGNSADYATLYVNLPLAHSTIRGIVQEFLYEQLIRRVRTESTESFVLTSTGLGVCEELFTPLFTSKEAEGALLVMKKNDLREEKSLHIRLDSKTYYFFGNVHRNFRDGKALQIPVNANQKGIVQFWFGLDAGRVSITIREKISKLLLQLSRQKKTTSPNSIRVVSLQRYILLDIISAFRSKEGVPEEYYPYELRVSSFCDQLWRA